MTESSSSKSDLSLPRSRRLCHDLEYQAVYGARMKKQRGPITAFVAPNGRGHWRLGLAVGKRVGNAVARNTVKRALREAFRHVQHELPLLADGQGCDMVLSAHAHAGLGAKAYEAVVLELAGLAQREWVRRGVKQENRADGEKREA
ncbi:MAG TPA: ribonuclease P protein component [Phycisphaerales bacterium]|nr:ribonuclease P protein component [Phycisphaerales bacterium]